MDSVGCGFASECLRISGRVLVGHVTAASRCVWLFGARYSKSLVGRSWVNYVAHGLAVFSGRPPPALPLRRLVCEGQASGIL